MCVFPISILGVHLLRAFCVCLLFCFNCWYQFFSSWLVVDLAVGCQDKSEEMRSIAILVLLFKKVHFPSTKKGLEYECPKIHVLRTTLEIKLMLSFSSRRCGLAPFEVSFLFEDPGLASHSSRSASFSKTFGASTETVYSRKVFTF